MEDGLTVEPSLTVFYNLVRETRAGMLDWLDSLPPEVFVHRDERFAFGSLQAIQSHVALTYLKWIGTVGLNDNLVAMEVRDVAGLRRAFDKVDLVAEKALRTFVDLDEPYHWTYPDGRKVSVSRRWLILHPITHEFHHKGQSLALARVLGHPHPGTPDSDLIYSPRHREF